MSEPALCYGVNIGRIPEGRRHFPEGVVDGSGQLNAAELYDNLAEGLKVFTRIDGFTMSQEGYDPCHVHIGQRITSTYRGDQECESFDVAEIARLRQNPSALIRKLKKVGLEVKPRELALYVVPGN